MNNIERIRQKLKNLKLIWRVRWAKIVRWFIEKSWSMLPQHYGYYSDPDQTKNSLNGWVLVYFHLSLWYKVGPELFYCLVLLFYRIVTTLSALWCGGGMCQVKAVTKYLLLHHPSLPHISHHVTDSPEPELISVSWWTLSQWTETR